MVGRSRNEPNLTLHLQVDMGATSLSGSTQVQWLCNICFVRSVLPGVDGASLTAAHWDKGKIHDGEELLA